MYVTLEFVVEEQRGLQKSIKRLLKFDVEDLASAAVDGDKFSADLGGDEDHELCEGAKEDREDFFFVVHASAEIYTGEVDHGDVTVFSSFHQSRDEDGAHGDGGGGGFIFFP